MIGTSCEIKRYMFVEGNCVNTCVYSVLFPILFLVNFECFFINLLLKLFCRIISFMLICISRM